MAVLCVFVSGMADRDCGGFGEESEIYKPWVFHGTGLFRIWLFSSIYDAGFLGSERQPGFSFSGLYDRGYSSGMVYGKSARADESSEMVGLFQEKMEF